MVVVVIIGLLAALAMPAFFKIQQLSRFTRFHSDMRVFRDGIHLFMMDQGRLPIDSNTGTLDDEMKPYISEAKFSQPTAIGGRWDIEGGSGGSSLAQAGVGVQGHTLTNAEMLVFDERFDDGTLEGGSMQAISSDRYYWVIEESDD